MVRPDNGYGSALKINGLSNHEKRWRSVKYALLRFQPYDIVDKTKLQGQ